MPFPERHLEQEISGLNTLALVQRAAEVFLTNDTSPTMLLSASRIPDYDLTEWLPIAKRLREVDPQNTAINTMAKTMQGRTIDILQNYPRTPDVLLERVVAQGIKVLPAQEKSTTIRPETSVFLGEVLALVNAGLIDKDTAREIINPGSEAISNPLNYLDNIVNVLLHTNMADGMALITRVIQGNRNSEIVTFIKAEASEIEEKESNQFDEKEANSDISSTSYFLFRLRKHYSEKKVQPLVWNKYINELNQLLLSQRLGRKHISRTGEQNKGSHVDKSRVFLSEDLTFPNGEKRKLSFQAAFQFFIACIIYGQENNLIK